MLLILFDPVLICFPSNTFIIQGSKEGLKPRCWDYLRSIWILRTDVFEASVRERHQKQTCVFALDSNFFFLTDLKDTCAGGQVGVNWQLTKGMESSRPVSSIGSLLSPRLFHWVILLLLLLVNAPLPHCSHSPNYLEMALEFTGIAPLGDDYYLRH